MYIDLNACLFYSYKIWTLNRAHDMRKFANQVDCEKKATRIFSSSCKPMTNEAPLKSIGRCKTSTEIIQPVDPP